MDSNLVGKNIKVLFVSSGNAKNVISPIIKSQGESLKQLGIDLNYFLIKGKGFKGYIKNIFKLNSYLSKSSYEIIHVHYGLSGIVAHLARHREKLVVSLMGNDLIGSINSKGRYSLFGYLEVMLNKFYLRKYDFIITKSQNLKDKIRYKCQNEIIPNGVDLTKFRDLGKRKVTELLHIKDDKRNIIFVSNPKRKEKNYELAKDAFNLLNDKNIELITVHSIGQEKLNLYYSAADLLIMTSYHEGSPNVIKEAMACNCPIVSTDVGDVKWVIGSTEGCFIASFEPEDIATKIKMALDFSEKVGRTKGRERIINLGLDSDTIAKKIISVYKKVLN